jgi:hypothetical protein
MAAAQQRAEEARKRQEESAKAKTESIKTFGIASQSRQIVSMEPTFSSTKPPRGPPTRKGGKKRKVTKTRKNRTSKK